MEIFRYLSSSKKPRKDSENPTLERFGALASRVGAILWLRFEVSGKVMSYDEEKARGKTIEETLRGVFVTIVLLWVIGIIFISKTLTLNDIYFTLSLISLWGVFEFVIKIDKACKRLENAESLSEFISAFASLLWILITQDLKNKMSNFIKKSSKTKA